MAHSLLKQIEKRGTHAAGFAYVNRDGSAGVYKQAKPGSQLALAELPRKSDTVVLHTRYATQGPASNNINNHPVVSPDLNVALVHNGVISNDDIVRVKLERMGVDVSQLAEVDSTVIPALVEKSGIEDLDMLAGYAAISWVDQRDPGVLNLARLKTSPVAYTHLRDGSFVFASTETLLEMALIELSLDYGAIFTMDEKKYMVIQDGFIFDMVPTKAMTYDSYSWQRYGNATAGGHGKTPTGVTTPKSSYPGTTPPRTIVPNVTTDIAKGSEDKPKIVGSSFGEVEDDGDLAESVDKYLDDLAHWRAKRALEDQKIAGKALVVTGEQQRSMAMDESDDVDPNWDIDKAWETVQNRWLEQEDDEDDDKDPAEFGQDHMSCSVMSEDVTPRGEGFYILDNDGNIHHAGDLEDLENRLAWYANITKSDQDLFHVDKAINWINHIMDVGSIEADGELVSWVDDTASIDDHESPAVYSLNYIREGASSLSSLKGA